MMASPTHVLLAIIVCLLVTETASFLHGRVFSSRQHMSLQQSSKAKAPAGKDKVKVKLSVDVKGQGKKGDIIAVSPALWTNVLNPKKQAVRMTDDEIQKESAEKKENAKQKLEAVQALASKIDTMKGADKAITVSKKVGSNGQLFGSVNAKSILETLKKSANDKMLDEKGVGVTSITIVELTDSSDDTGKVDEIRRAGLYRVEIKLPCDITAQFEFLVSQEKK
jgi:large subunit ribosomal protein L9